MICSSPGLRRHAIRSSPYRALARSELGTAAACPPAVERLSVEERVRASAMPDVIFEPAVHLVTCIPEVVQAWYGRLSANCIQDEAAAVLLALAVFPFIAATISPYKLALTADYANCKASFIRVAISPLDFTPAVPFAHAPFSIIHSAVCIYALAPSMLFAFYKAPFIAVTSGISHNTVTVSLSFPPLPIVCAVGKVEAAAAADWFGHGAGVRGSHSHSGI